MADNERGATGGRQAGRPAAQRSGGQAALRRGCSRGGVPSTSIGSGLAYGAVVPGLCHRGGQAVQRAHVVARGALCWQVGQLHKLLNLLDPAAVVAGGWACKRGGELGRPKRGTMLHALGGRWQKGWPGRVPCSRWAVGASCRWQVRQLSRLLLTAAARGAQAPRRRWRTPAAAAAPPPAPGGGGGGGQP